MSSIGLNLKKTTRQKESQKKGPIIRRKIANKNGYHVELGDKYFKMSIINISVEFLKRP